MEGILSANQSQFLTGIFNSDLVKSSAGKQAQLRKRIFDAYLASRESVDIPSDLPEDIIEIVKKIHGTKRSTERSHGAS